MTNENQFIDKNVINDNFMFVMPSTVENDLNIASFFNRCAPIYWKKDDINACITSQFTNALFNVIPNELENVKKYTFLYQLDRLNKEINWQEDEITYRPEPESFIEKFCFFVQTSEILENHIMISQLLLAYSSNAVSAIQNAIYNSIKFFIEHEKTSLYELVILISDINQFAQFLKLMYVDTVHCSSLYRLKFLIVIAPLPFSKYRT